MRAGIVPVFAILVVCGSATREASALCAGFTDVLSGGNCTAVTWIKNRQITLGCTSATLYCPDDPVSRLAMAAFMNRLGNVITPLVLDDEESGASLDLTAPKIVCQTDSVPAVGYPRTMIVQASLSFALAGLQNVSFGVATGQDGGAFGFDYPLLATNGTGVHQLHYIGTLRPIAAGSSYRFAVRVGRSGSLPVPLGAWGCHLQVTIVNAFGSQ